MSLQEKLFRDLQKELEDKAPNLNKIGSLTEQLLQQDKDAMRFSVDARHIHRLGFELVGKQETAIGELVKNAYDADASLVTINVKDFDEPGGLLVIEDDGEGMSEEDIRNKWMVITTSDKEDNPVSPVYKRSKAGRKGIGRFATERLGEKLILESRQDGRDTGIRVTFAWDDNYQHGKSLVNIANSIDRFPKSVDEKGTTLIVVGLRDAWKGKDFDKIWKSLLFLQSPFIDPKKYRNKGEIADFSDPGFQIQINDRTESNAAKEYSFEKSFFENQTAFISGQIDGNSNVSYQLKSQVLDYEDEFEPEVSYELTGPVVFAVHYFIYSSKLMSGPAIRSAQKMGHSHGGMKVYRDGFRVLPYGETHDDWLKLGVDSARRSILVPLNNPNIFGYVEIDSTECVLLEETSSREGFIENEAYEQLRTFVREGVEWAALRIASVRGKKQKAGEKGFNQLENEDGVQKPSDLFDEVIDDLKYSFKDKTEDGDVKEVFEKLEGAKARAKGYEKLSEKRKKEHIEYEALLRILASLGISIAVFSHEISGAVTQIRSALIKLKGGVGSNGEDARSNELFEDVEQSTVRLENLASYIIDQITHTSSREKSIVPVSAVVKAFIEQFENYLNTRGIQFEYSVKPEWLRTLPLHRSEIDSVLFNFLTNSIKAMERANNGRQAIKISAFFQDNFAVIRFQDTGKGVPSEIVDKIFDAFYTTSSHNHDELAGPGTGLGLKIVSDIAESNRGFVRVSTPDEGYGACFEFGVPVAPKQRKG